MSLHRGQGAWGCLWPWDTPRPKVNASDFTQGPLPECPVLLFIPAAEYVTGMNVTYLGLPLL